jgi:hypothetical protein
MHPNEIPKPTEIEWQPAIVTFLDERVRRICGPLEAFEVLGCGRADSLYLNARLCCRLALERKMSADEARLAFIAATADRMQTVV